MWREFRDFLVKENALALAIAVVLGAALNKVVTALVEDFIMPIVAVATPGGAWQTTVLPAGPFIFRIGDFASAVINFLIVGFVAWRLSKMFIRPAPAPGVPATRPCPSCRMNVDPLATRCAYCTSPLEPLPVAAAAVAARS